MVGLTTEQAHDLRRQGLGNQQIDTTQKTTKDIYKENIFTYFNLIFFILAILLLVVGSYKSMTFLPVVIANTAIGIIQELRAKKILDHLSVLNEPTATVMRDGEEDNISTDQLVLHDVIVLRSGNQIPADAVVISGEISVNEALLTGEADEITKGKGKELMSGSFVVSGQCYAELTRVGADSYISQLMLKAKKMSTGEQSEMIRSINRLVIAAGVAIVPVGVGLLAQGILNGNTFAQSVDSMVAAVVGMIPEGLYLLVSIALAMSAARLAMNRVMLHDMKSIETLARVDVICLDKTGTITDNNMLVADTVPADSACTPEQLAGYKKLVGHYIGALPDDNITMKALEDYFEVPMGVRCTSYLPFSSKYKYSSVQFDHGTFCMGAPDILLKNSYDRWSSLVNQYAEKGLRVLVFGQYYEGSTAPFGEGDNTDVAKSFPVPKNGLNGTVVPLLFILLQNPIRENAKQTFAYFVKQGVEIKVISGDNAVTVSEVARQAGIENADKFIDATKLRDDAAIREAVRKYTVFGRVTPEQKQKIVRALKKDGRTVAMSGDGVNDILAMKDADCSIAMAAGSEAAVQAAQVVLLDSDFSHMPQIVAEGRKNINNIERSATLFLVKNIFSLLLAIVSIINVWTYPLQPAQISLISAFNIGIPAFFLALEPNYKKISGNFMMKVVLRAMPAALTDFFAIVALVVFGDTFGVDAVDISVAATFLLAIVGFIILAQISAPLNKFRVIVMVGCIIGLMVTAFLFNDLFSIYYISTECIMLFVLFAIATEPCMRYLSLIFRNLEASMQNHLRKRRLKLQNRG